MTKKHKKTQKTLVNVYEAPENITTKLQKKIIFCKGTEDEVFRDSKEKANYQEKIKQLKLGGMDNFRELELDYKGEHNGMKIYTIKLNKRDRVVFHYQRDEAKKVCFLIIRELLLEHNYRDSKVLRDLENQLTPEKLAELSLKTPEEQLEFELADVETPTHVLEASELWFDEKIIILSEDQKKAEGSYTRMPFLVEGPPGSGKSIILLMGVYHRLQQLNVDDEAILVVAESEKVVAYLKKLWEENFSAMNSARVQFKTYKQVILERMALPPEERDEVNYFIGYEQFKAFYKEYRKNAPTKVIAKKQVKIDAVHYVLPVNMGKITEEALEELLCRAVYQELRVIAFWKSYDERIGQKDSYFDITTDNAEKSPSAIKDWIVKVYQNYPRKNHDLAFMQIPPEKQKKEFSAAFGDEIQDFSSEQWALLSCLSGGQLGGYFDSLQSVKADKPIISVLKSVLNTQYPNVTCDDSLILPDTYRCPAVVAAIAEPILSMRNALAGGTGRKGQLTRFNVAATELNKTGNAHLYLLKTEHEQNTLINEIKGHLGCYKPSEVVIISYENKDEVRRIFGENCMVLTPEEAKGLEFDLVILWHPMGKSSSSTHIIYKNANAKLKMQREKNGGTSSSHQHQAVLENMDNRFSRTFQELFTALTRAKKRVIFCQDDANHREHEEIVGKLSKLSLAFPPPERLPQASSALQSTDAEWHTVIYQLLLAGTTEEAKNLIQHHLHREEMDVNKRLNLYLQEYYQQDGLYNAIFNGLPTESRLFIKSILGEGRIVICNAVKSEKEAEHDAAILPLVSTNERTKAQKMLSQLKDIKPIEKIHAFDILSDCLNSIFNEMNNIPRNYTVIYEKIGYLNKMSELSNKDDIETLRNDIFENKKDINLIEKLDYIVDDLNVAKALFEVAAPIFLNVDLYEFIPGFLIGLFTRKDGLSFLVKWIDANPAFSGMIKKELFLSKFKGKFFLEDLLTSEGGQFSILFPKIFNQSNSWAVLESFLADEQIDRSLRRAIINPLLIKSEFTSSGKVDKFNSVFHHLVSSDSQHALSLLETLVNIINENFFNVIRENFCSDRYKLFLKYLADALTCRSSLDDLLPIFVLLQTPEKRKILLKIIEKTHAIIGKAENAKYFLAKMKSGEYAGQSVLHHLVNTEENIQTFLKIFSINKNSIIFSPLFPKGISEKSLFLNNKSPLECLCGFSEPTIYSLLKVMCTEKLIEIIRDVPALFTCIVISSPEKETLGELAMPKAINDTILATFKIFYNYSDEIQNDFIFKIKNNLRERSIDFEPEATIFGLIKKMLRGLNFQEYDSICQQAYELNQKAEKSRAMPGIIWQKGVDGVWDGRYMSAICDLLLSAVSRLMVPAVSISNIRSSSSVWTCSSAFHSVSGMSPEEMANNLSGALDIIRKNTKK